MALQKIEHSFSYETKTSDPYPSPTRIEIGELMSEFCDGAASRCAKTGGCVIGATSRIDQGTVHVDLRCEAKSYDDSLQGCAASQRTSASIDASVSDFLFSPTEE